MLSIACPTLGRDKTQRQHHKLHRRRSAGVGDTVARRARSTAVALRSKAHPSKAENASTAIMRAAIETITGSSGIDLVPAWAPE